MKQIMKVYRSSKIKHTLKYKKNAEIRRFFYKSGMILIKTFPAIQRNKLADDRIPDISPVLSDFLHDGRN